MFNQASWAFLVKPEEWSGEELFIKKYIKYLHLFNKVFLLPVDKKTFKFDNINEDIQKDLKKIEYKKSIMFHGPAGHGKTFTIKQMIKNNKDMKIKIVAPTWKAISIYGDVIDEERDTITSQKLSNLTRTDQGINDLKGLMKGTDILIVDEVSMIDEWDFLIYIQNNTRIIFSGDNFQIPPIHQNQPSEWLELVAKQKNFIIDFSNCENYRIYYKNKVKKEGKELEKADNINKLLIEIRNEKFSLKKSGSFNNIVEIQSEQEIFNRIKQLYKDNYRFLVANNIGKFGTELLNGIHSSDSDENYEFNEGDIIIFNTITEDLKKYKAHNQTEAKLVKQKWNEKEEKIVYTLKNSWHEFNYSCQKGDEPFEKAKFLTAHKAQGSSIDKVAVIITSPVSYRWLYSASSRASNNLKILFNNSDFDILYKEDKLRHKDTLNSVSRWLEDKINDEI